MKTIYLNTKQYGQTETVDQFTQGEDAPENYRDFKKYVNDMVSNYNLNGMNVYKSQKCTKEWRQK